MKLHSATPSGTSQTIFHNKLDIKLVKPAKNPKTHQ